MTPSKLDIIKNLQPALEAVNPANVKINIAMLEYYICNAIVDDLEDGDPRRGLSLHSEEQRNFIKYLENKAKQAKIILDEYRVYVVKGRSASLTNRFGIDDDNTFIQFELTSDYRVVLSKMINFNTDEFIPDFETVYTELIDHAYDVLKVWACNIDDTSWYALWLPRGFTQDARISATKLAAIDFYSLMQTPYKLRRIRKDLPIGRTDYSTSTVDLDFNIDPGTAFTAYRTIQPKRINNFTALQYRRLKAISRAANEFLSTSIDEITYNLRRRLVLDMRKAELTKAPTPAVPSIISRDFFPMSYPHVIKFSLRLPPHLDEDGPLTYSDAASLQHTSWYIIDISSVFNRQALIAEIYDGNDPIPFSTDQYSSTRGIGSRRAVSNLFSTAYKNNQISKEDFTLAAQFLNSVTAPVSGPEVDEFYEDEGA